MRKSEILLFHLKRAIDSAGEVPPDIQFKIVTRLQIEDALDEDHSLENLFLAILKEIEITKEESISF